MKQLPIYIILSLTTPLLSAESKLPAKGFGTYRLLVRQIQQRHTPP